MRLRMELFAKIRRDYRVGELPAARSPRAVVTYCGLTGQLVFVGRPAKIIVAVPESIVFVFAP